jgi:hypothetical protein
VKKLDYLEANMKKILLGLIVILSHYAIYPQYFLNFQNVVSSWIKTPSLISNVCNVGVSLGCLVLTQQAFQHARWHWKEIGMVRHTKLKAVGYGLLGLGIGTVGCYTGFYGIKNAGNSLYTMLMK